MSRQAAASLTAESPGAFLGRSIFDPDVPTPFVYIDLDVLERNIAVMAGGARQAGIGVRPHAKAHKTLEIARRQLEAGAIGLTVAKLSEAAVFIDAGVETSYLIAQPFVGASKVRWALELAERCELLLSVDDLRLAEQLGAQACAVGGALDVVLVVDATEYGRFGVPLDLARPVAGAVAAIPGLQLRGIESYPGNLYSIFDADDAERVTYQDADGLSGLAADLEHDGLPCDVVSTGNTPASQRLFASGLPPGITEVRPGNYVFRDREQMALGSAHAEETALSVVTSVVSAPVEGRGVVDAGLKTLSGAALDPDDGFGGITNRTGVSLDGLWEECGRVRVGAGEALVPGERLRVTPNHACEVPNLAEILFVGRENRIDEAWRPVARGKVW
jgi:D-serine deaminase-like pyridoxal phosphate-dependent protein